MMIAIAQRSDLTDFFHYLSEQLKENGAQGTPLFQPVSREQSVLDDGIVERFSKGNVTPVGQPGWRLLWLAKDQQGQISGHIDLRPYGDEYDQHRVQLGMGVHRNSRKQGLGQRLLDTAVDYCQKNDAIAWLDLSVMSCNEPAKRLYVNYGFSLIGEITDRYRIDGESIGEIVMTLRT